MGLYSGRPCFMKAPNIMSDKGMFVILVRVGLTGCIGLLFYSLNKSIGLPIALIAPVLLTAPIFDTKRYRNLVFKDEKIPHRRKNSNVLLVFLFATGYCLSVFLCNELSGYYDFERYSGLWILSTNIIYFLGVLYLFVNRIYVPDKKMGKRTNVLFLLNLKMKIGLIYSRSFFINEKNEA
jgi:hypothetical protein